MIFFSKNIVILFFGDSYINAAYPLQILAINSLLKYYTVFNILIYNCFKKYSTMQSFNILQAVLNIVFDILFIPYLGIAGAAFGTLISFVVSTGIETIYGNLYLKNFLNNAN